LWAFLNATDAKAVTLEAIATQERRHKLEMERLRADVAAIDQKHAA
jgi:hypothetical protein